MNTNSPTSIPALSESLRASHRQASHLEMLLSGILGALTGEGQLASSKGEGPSSGIVSDADILSGRLTALIATAERIQNRVAPELSEGAEPATAPGYALRNG
jgi:hypothetical protein